MKFQNLESVNFVIEGKEYEVLQDKGHKVRIKNDKGQLFWIPKSYAVVEMEEKIETSKRKYSRKDKIVEENTDEVKSDTDFANTENDSE